MSQPPGKRGPLYPNSLLSSEEKFDSILESNSISHGSQRSQSSSFSIFSERHLETVLKPDSFTPLASNRIVTALPVNQQAHSNVEIFDQLLSFRGLHSPIEENVLAQMLAQDDRDWPPGDVEGTSSQITLPAPPRRASFVVSQARVLAQGDAELTPEVVEENSAQTISPAPPRKTTSQIPPAGANSVRTRPRRADLRRVESSTPIGYANAKLPRTSSFFGRLRRAATSTTIPTEARYGKFEKQRKKEGRDAWSKFKQWIGRK